MWITANAARFRRAHLAGFALVILSASLAEAEYGPRTKIGANYQQSSTTRSTNGIDPDPGSCSGVINCYVLFQVPPAQKALVVQHMSCRGHVTAGGLYTGYLRTRKGGTVPLRRTPILPVNTAAGWWVVISPVMHLVESGERPLVYLANSASANWVVECTISGKLQ